MTSTNIPDDPRKRLYYVITMPVSADGYGPADLKEAVKLTYEVWDQFLTTFGNYNYLPDAIQRCEELNKEYYIGT